MNIRAARFLTQALGGLCGFLLLLALVQYAGFGRGYRWAEDPGDAAARLQLADIDKQAVQLPPASSFSDIAAHPLFNADRLPTPLDASEGEDAAPPLQPLNVALTGVILDTKNQVSIAMLQDKSSNQALALKVGMPLEGEQASWTLVEVKPRVVVFRNAANEVAEVELETSTVAPPPPRGGKGKAPVPPSRQPVNSNAKNNANANGGTDLAKRIEERRKQMREDAERLRRGEKANSATPKK